MITQYELQAKLHYNPNTGIFVNKKKNKITGSVHSKGYISIGVCGKVYLAHRLAWLYVYGYLPDMQIDHINHNKQDNRINNLRVVTNSENHKNKGVSKHGIFGVKWYEPYQMWRARITVDRKDISLGYFKEYNDAVNARKNAEAYYGFHSNHGKGK